MQQIEKEKSKGFARYNGALIVSLAVVIHVMFLYSILKTIFLDWFKNHIDKVNAGIQSLFIFSVFGFAFYYYNIEKTDKNFEWTFLRSRSYKND